MSCAARRSQFLSSSLYGVSTRLALTSPRNNQGVRRYVQAILKTRGEPLKDYASPRSYTKAPQTTTTVLPDTDEFDSRGMSSSGAEVSLTSTSNTIEDFSEGFEHKRSSGEAWRVPDPMFESHLSGLFSPLQFPLELARRILTHGSHPAAVHGHNAGLGFIGRRVLESYLLLFLNSSSALSSSHDVESITSRTLNIYTLGEHVGSQWGLGRVLRWTPAASADLLNSSQGELKSLKSVGLYKVQGDTVAAVMGGIYYHFGGSVAHRVFHTRLLPHILLAGRAEGLSDSFHRDALSICDSMGGREGPLVLSRPVQH